MATSTFRPVARCCSCAFQASLKTPASRASSLVVRQRRTQTRRYASTDASAKISGIVDQISTLTLLETADLVAALKSHLKIPDMPMGNFAAGPGAGGAAAAAASPVEEEEAAPKAAEKTLFNLTLKSFDAAAKPKVIKEIKSLLNLSLVESKKFAESAPKQMKENVNKEDAEKIIETMKAVGAVVVME